MASVSTNSPKARRVIRDDLEIERPNLDRGLAFCARTCCPICRTNDVYYFLRGHPQAAWNFFPTSSQACKQNCPFCPFRQSLDA